MLHDEWKWEEYDGEEMMKEENPEWFGIRIHNLFEKSLKMMTECKLVEYSDWSGGFIRPCSDCVAEVKVAAKAARTIFSPVYYIQQNAERRAII